MKASEPERKATARRAAPFVNIVLLLDQKDAVQPREERREVL